MCPGLYCSHAGAIAILISNTGSSHPSQLMVSCSPMIGNPRERGRHSSPGFPPWTSYSGRIRSEIHKVQAVGFYEAHLEGKTLTLLLAMRKSKSFKTGPLSAAKHQSHLTPSAASPRLQVQSLFSVSEGFSCTPSSVLVSRWSSQPALVTILLLPPSACASISPSLGLKRSSCTPPGRLAAGAGAQQALLPASGSTHRNHLWEARLLDGFDGFSPAGMSFAGDHQPPKLKGFVTQSESLPILPGVSFSYQVH